MTFPDLEPAIVWRHFATLCEIPRVSKHEGALRRHLRAWAGNRGLAALEDATGNLILRKPATAGMEDRPMVTLQGHLDMVCQQNTGGGHDFFRDPIRPVLKDGWLCAENTTLGADNGIGVALALAALEADDIAHGSLEVLLTVDEEAGMGGAQGLPAGVLQGQLLINLDTEEWGQFYLGCAGGLDVVVESACGSEAVPAGHQVFSLTVQGLQGGHSGIDIHRERGHAIKLLVRLLRALEQETPLRLARLEGGTARNALPREAVALIAVPAAAGARLPAWAAAMETLLRDELAAADPALSVAIAPAHAETVLPLADQRRLLAALHAAPQGVRRRSQRVDGVVETSDNLGVIRIADGRAEATFMVRSLIDRCARELADEIIDLFHLAGCAARPVGPYPAWTPQPDSPLAALAQQVYAQEFGAPAGFQVIHAGLECGIIGAKYPDLPMISFGPDIRGAHAPGERVEVASVGRCWHLLKALLTALPADWAMLTG